MAEVRLRPIAEADLDALAANQTVDADPWNHFGFRASNALHRRFAVDGFLTEDAGKLAVESKDGALVGEVSWSAVCHGPSAACRALNIGIALLVRHRGQGYGSAAQRALADYLFATTLVERLEAGTDVDNIAEQRALERAGFTREGVLRHAQFRQGKWHDMVLYSRLRSDPS